MEFRDRDECDAVYEQTVRRRNALRLLSFSRSDAVLRQPRCHPLLDAAVLAIEENVSFCLDPETFWVTVLHGYSQFPCVFDDMVYAQAPHNVPRHADLDSHGFTYANPQNDWSEIFSVFIETVKDAFPEHSYMKLIFDAVRGDAVRGDDATRPDPYAMAVAAAAIDIEFSSFPRRDEFAVSARPGDFLRTVCLGGTPGEWNQVCNMITLLLRDTTNRHASAWLTQVMVVAQSIEKSAEDFEAHAVSDPTNDFWKYALFVTQDGKLSGHLTKLYPMDRYGAVAWRSARTINEFPLSGFRSVPFQWHSTEIPTTPVVKHCALHAGIVGVCVTRTESRPVWSWAVTQESA